MKEIKDLPLVSIIAICHKHAAYVIETLESIRNQTYPNIELIIINNVKDECESIIQNWIKEHDIRCFFIQNQQPKTVTQNCNIGLSNCGGKYFQVIACDDVMLPDKILNQVTLFEILPNDYACIYGDTLKIDEESNIISKETEFERLRRILDRNDMPKGGLKDELSERPFIHAPTVLLRTNVIKAIGGYDKEFWFEDWPMWIKLSYLGYYFQPINEVNVHYRILSTSLDRNRPIQFYTTHINTFKKYRKYLKMKSKGLRNHWLIGLIHLKKYNLFLFFKESLYFLFCTKDFRIRTLFKLVFG